MYMHFGRGESRRPARLAWGERPKSKRARPV